MSELEGVKQKSALRSLEGTWTMKRDDRIMRREYNDGEKHRMWVRQKI